MSWPLPLEPPLSAGRGGLHHLRRGEPVRRDEP